MTLAEVDSHDRRVALSRLDDIIGDTPYGLSYFARLAGDPVPKGRPRSTATGRHYTPAATVIAEALMADALHKACKEPSEAPLALVVVAYVPDVRLADADNILKLVMDAGNAGTTRNPKPTPVWKDDKQIVRAAAFLEFDPDNPRTLVGWCEIESLLDRRITAARRRKLYAS